MLVTTFGKKPKPFFNPLTKPKGIDFSGRTYSNTSENNKKFPIPKEIQNEIKNNILDIPERPDNLYKWAVELSHSQNPKDKERAGDVLLLAVLAGSQRALGELGSLIIEDAPSLSRLKLKYQWNLVDGQRFLEAAARCGDADAHLMQGYFNLSGQGGFEQNIDKAIRCYDRAAKAGLKKGTKAIEFITSDILTKTSPQEYAKQYTTYEKIGNSTYNFARE